MQLALEVHSILGAGGHPDYQQLYQARQTLQNHLHTVTQQLGRMATLQLFWEPIHGSGFSEDHSIRRSIAISRQSAEVRFHLPFYAEGIRRLRLDPAEYPCLVHIEHSSLHSEHNEVLWQWPKESNPEAPLIRQPFSSINEDTVLLGKDRLGTTRISIFSRSHDPALLVDIPETILAKASGPCSFIIKARWEPLSAEMCDIFTQLGRLWKTPPPCARMAL